jgi:hypothetical protein
MQNQTIKISTTGEKFQNAEQLWFWFLYSRATRAGYKNGAKSTGRVCELLDVETLITKLYLSGKLTAEQLSIMKQYGDKKRAPHQYVYSENRAAHIWSSAMSVLSDAATKRGWLE